MRRFKRMRQATRPFRYLLCKRSMMNHTPIFVYIFLVAGLKKDEPVPRDKQFIGHVSMVKLAGGDHRRYSTQPPPIDDAV
jgi:hypothetical protein